MKDGYKINKELIKMRNDFRNTNLRNQLIMKNCFKHATSKSELVNYGGELLLHDIKIFSDDTEECIQDLQEDMTNLILCNDSNFKINNKTKLQKLKTDDDFNVKYKNKSKAFNLKTNNNEISNIIEEDQQNSIRIECTYAYKSPKASKHLLSRENSDTQIVQTNGFKKDPENGISTHVTDLKTSSLMLMAFRKSNTDTEILSPEPVYEEKIQNVEIESCPLITAEGNGNITETLHILPLRIEMSERRRYVAKKYLTKWKELVTKKKEYMSNQRKETLNNFFDKLSKKKNSMQSPEFINKAKKLAHDSNTYEHR